MAWPKKNPAMPTPVSGLFTSRKPGAPVKTPMLGTGAARFAASQLRMDSLPKKKKGGL
jgi:hypothetical protein